MWSTKSFHFKSSYFFSEKRDNDDVNIAFEFNCNVDVEATCINLSPPSMLKLHPMYLLKTVQFTPTIILKSKEM